MKNKKELQQIISTSISHVIQRERSMIGKLGLHERSKRIGSSKLENIYDILSKFGFLGHLISCLIILGKVSIKEVYDGFIFLDHSSNKIKDNLIPKYFNSTNKKTVVINTTIKDYINIFYFYLKFLRFLPKLRIPEIHAINRLAIAYIVSMKYFSNYNHIVISVDDFSPDRLGILLSALKKGNEISLMRMSDELNRGCLFLPYKNIYCWSVAQVDETHGNCKKPILLNRVIRRINIKEFNNNTVIGIVSNAFLENESILQFILYLRNNNIYNEIIIRLHPRACKNSNIDMPNIYFQPKGEGLIEFLKEVNVVYAGNTSAINEIIFNGVPVIYTDKLNSFRKSKNTKKKYNVNYLCPSYDDLSLNKSIEYYKSKEFEKKKNIYLNKNI